MPRFRKKPVEIEAIFYDGTSTGAHEIRKWMNGEKYVRHPVRSRDLGPMFIDTLEGEMRAKIA